MVGNTIVPATDDSAIILRPIGSTPYLKARHDKILEIRDTVMIESVHYGPPYEGSKKQVLLKPGAEMLVSYFGLRPYWRIRTEVERWDTRDPLFHYRYECELYDIQTGLLVGSGIGSCNSWEAKYRWRWIEESKLPPNFDKAQSEAVSSTISEFSFSVEKGETTGQYGKPPEYWQRFRDAIANGTARKITKETRKKEKYDAWEIGGTVYRAPNDDMFSVVNTIDKQAQKRALVAATLVTTGASDLFTQDVEDFKGHKYFGDPDAFEIVDGSFTPVIRPVDITDPPPVPPTQPTSQSPVHWTQHTQIWPKFVKWLADNGYTPEAAAALLGLESWAKAPPDDGTEAGMEAAAKAACEEVAHRIKQPRGMQQPSSVWTDESALDFNDWIVANYNMMHGDLLKVVDKKDWRKDFKTPAAARTFVEAEAQKRQIPFVCTKLQYVNFAKGKSVDFYGPGLIAKMPGGPTTIKEKLGEVGEAFAARNKPEDWKVGSEYQIDALKVIWSLNKNGRPEVTALELVHPYETEEVPAETVVDLAEVFPRKEEPVSEPA
jgi:hypothetical protein